MKLRTDLMNTLIQLSSEGAELISAGHAAEIIDTQVVLHGMLHGMLCDMLHGMLYGMLYGMLHGMLNGMPHGMLHDMLHGMVLMVCCRV